MNQGKKLTLEMAVFFLIVFVTFGTIIIKEKSTILFMPKIEQKMTNYINENYKDLNLKQNKLILENNTYKIKLTNPENNNLYFYVTYKNKEISDTYDEDYIKGKSLIKHLSISIEDTIKEKTNNKYNVVINQSYDNFSEKVKKLLLREENIESLKIYTLEIELETEWNHEVISRNISDTISNLKKNNITPKNYTITITDKKDITKSVKIYNINDNLIENNTLDKVINDIIKKEKTNILSQNDITYEYLN